jgi:hypothetical protein
MKFNITEFCEQLSACFSLQFDPTVLTSVFVRISSVTYPRIYCREILGTEVPEKHEIISCSIHFFFLSRTVFGIMKENECYANVSELCSKKINNGPLNMYKKQM